VEDTENTSINPQEPEKLKQLSENEVEYLIKLYKTQIEKWLDPDVLREVFT
jgi:hypothetical protein